MVAAGSVGLEGLYRVVRPQPFAALPEWITAALAPSEPLRVTGRGPDIDPRHVGAYVRAITECEAAALAAAPVGTRHNARLKAARTLGRLVAGGDLDEATAVEALREASEVHVGRDCTRAEVETDIKDGLDFGRRLPRRVSRNGAPS